MGTIHRVHAVRPSDSSRWCSLSTACRLPMPEPIEHSHPYGSSSSIWKPDWAMRLSCCSHSVLAERLHTSRRFYIHVVPAQSLLTSAARCALYSDASNLVISPIPCFPSLWTSQKSSTFNPDRGNRPHPCHYYSFHEILLYVHTAVYTDDLAGNVICFF